MTSVRTGGWTAAQRKNLSALRAPHKADPEDFVLGPEAAWADLISRKAASGAIPEVLSVEAELERLGVLTQRFAGYGMKSYHTDFMKPLVGLWVGVGGLAFPLGLVFPEMKEPPSKMSFGRNYLDWWFWPILRRYLFAADEADYEAARRSVAPMYEALNASKDYEDHKLRDWLAFAFSREPIWSHQLAEAEIKGETSLGESEHILASMTDADLAGRWLAATGRSFSVLRKFWVYDVVEGLGAASRPILETLLERSTRADERKPVESALKLAEKLEAGPEPAPPPAAKAPAAKEPKAKKPKAPALAPLPERLTLTIGDDLREASAAWRAEQHPTPESDAAQLKQIEGYLDDYRLYLWWAMGGAMQLSDEARLAWAKGLDPKMMAVAMRDRNGFSLDQMVKGFILPFGETEPELVISMILLAKPERLLQLAELAWSPSIAVRIAEVAEGKKGAIEATSWLEGHAEAAAPALIVGAVTGKAKPQAACLAALARLGKGTRGEPVRRAIEAQPEAVRTYLEQLRG